MTWLPQAWGFLEDEECSGSQNNSSELSLTSWEAAGMPCRCRLLLSVVGALVLAALRVTFPREHGR